ncbi:MAG: histidine ammonia-lyase [Firmicutes bacterium]|nr:histidine ammonia-lyase [Bacillota bacterium]
MNNITLTGEGLSLSEVVAVARHGAEVTLSESARGRVEKAARMVDQLLAESRVVYGITTGFGKFSDTVISPQEVAELQRNLILSHAVGVGRPLPVEAVRGIMLLRANALAKGHSGVRLPTLELLIEMINRRLHPVIPEKGSLGASGDLAPLAHMALVLIGEGEVWREDTRIPSLGEMGSGKGRDDLEQDEDGAGPTPVERELPSPFSGAAGRESVAWRGIPRAGWVLPGREALSMAGLSPVVLSAKEGLALINGTQVMTAIGALALFDAQNLLRAADIVASLTLQALRGISAAFDPKIQMVRPHPGSTLVAANLRQLLEGSQLTTDPGEIRVQDAYTLRCLPQVHGASRDAVSHVAQVLEREINAATDNPLIFAEEAEVISGGNFHGQPVALAMDYLGIALAELGNIAERRIERLVNPQLSGLPAFLTPRGGLNSGMMLLQYTAAALVSENKILASPASVDSIPSSANQEDHVSMGTIAARKAREILDNVTRILAIEYLAACQAVDFLGAHRLSPLGRRAHELLRRDIPTLEEDRFLAPDIEKAVALLQGGLLSKVAGAADF